MFGWPKLLYQFVIEIEIWILFELTNKFKFLKDMGYALFSHYMLIKFSRYYSNCKPYCSTDHKIC